MKKRAISLFLVLALVVGVCPATFANEDPSPEGNVLSSSFDEETGTLTIVTTDQTVTVTLEDVGGNTIISQFNDGVLVDQEVCAIPNQSIDAPEQQIIDSLEVLAANASHKYFMGTVYYTGGMDPTYTMNVKVYDTYTDPIQTEYTPPSGTLTVAKLVNRVSTILGLPAAAASSWVGVVISIIGIISGEYVIWKEGHQPHLTCDKYEHTFDMYHYGTAPIYYNGQLITRRGTHYFVKDTNHESSTANNYYEGFFIHGPTAEDALTIYYELYRYPQWEYLRWDANVR